MKLLWLVCLRWIALAGLLAAAALGRQLGFLAAELLPFYLAVVSGLFLWNVISYLWVVYARKALEPADLAIQIAMDLGVMTLLLSVTGGIYNPFTSLLLVHAAMAALLLQGFWLWFLLALICAGLGYLQWNPDVSHLDLTGTVTRPVISIAYVLIVLLLSFLIAGLRRALGILEENVRALRERQDRLDRLRLAGAMAAGFSHELSTPLYTLKLRLERLRRGLAGLGSGERVREDLETAEEALHQCERILRNLNDSGFKASALKLESVPVRSTLSRWISEYCATSGRGNLRLVATLPERVCLEIPVQPLRKSFFDLLDNAFEAGEGEVQVELAESRNSDGREIRLSIINEGEAFPELVLQKWGEPFVTTKDDGTGLGLFNAITLVRAMGGGVIANRESGGRTRVLLTLPAEPAEEAGF